MVAHVNALPIHEVIHFYNKVLIHGQEISSSSFDKKNIKSFDNFFFPK